MRIVGGALAGRIFAGPAGKATRPTSDRAREAIASAIEARRGFEGALVVDLFAGTGAFSFEALSRGARRAIAIDSDGRQVRAIEKSAIELGLADRVSVLRADLSKPRALDAIPERAIDLVFADPPWAEVAEIEPLLAALGQRLASDGLCVVVHASRDAPRTARASPRSGAIATATRPS